MAGGEGHDTYIVAAAGDRTVEVGGQGTDTVRSYIDWTLSANVERLELQGSSNLVGGGNVNNNTLVGNAGDNRLFGFGGEDYLAGGGGNDVIVGGDGDDWLVGGAGNDWMTGGTGADKFLFNAALNPLTNVDTVSAFVAADDVFQLDDAIFTALTTRGTLASSAFHIGASAADASDRIVYNNATGQISYDADGSGGGAAIHFANVSANLAITHDDFFVI
jgi:Ca2+-binding RTX toxin-like protein